jgi:DNA ligase (NAD+)
MQLLTLSVKELEELIRHHNRLYWDEQKPEISDYDYDRLVNRLKELAPKSPVLVAMGPSKPVAVDGEEVKHKVEMLSLDKVYDEGELGKWAASFEGDVVMSPKFDGIACALHYSHHGELTLAATRGDGKAGDNITANVREIADVPRKVKARGIEVRGEIFMKLSVFKNFKDQGFANPRNLAAGAVKQKDTAKSRAYKLSFAAYDVIGTDLKTEAEKMDFLAEIGFPPIERKTMPKSDMQKGYDEMAKKRSSLDFEIDGVVFRINSCAEQKRLGVTAHHPRYAIAYKFQGDSGTTKLVDIEWSVARSGAITPVVIIEPVELSGAMVSRASLHHPGFIAKLGLKKNAEVVVMRRGGVIPNVELVAKPGDAPIEMPTKCPSCGSAVRWEKDFLFCSKPSKCRAAVIGQLIHFAATVDMKGFGDAVVANGYDKGFLRGPADFYTLTLDQLLTLDRMGEKSAKNLLGEVDKRRTLDLGTFLRAFGLPELGKNVSNLLAERHHDLASVFAVTEDEIGQINSIGPVIAKAVVTGLAEARGTIEAVAKHVKLAEPPKADASAASGPLVGQSFVFTGKMATLERKAAEALVRANGGTPLDSVGKALTFLVVGDQKTPDKSTKQKAAEKLIAQGAAIKVITESEFLKRVGPSASK